MDSVEDMTSPDFMYPQPTDDELAAQQPQSPYGRLPMTTHPLADASAITSASSAQSAVAGSPRLGKAAMTVAIIAAALTLIASSILAVSIGPMEVTNGYYFTDTPQWYQNLAIGLVGLQALCTGLGITGLIMGIVAAVTGRGRTQGIVATAVAVLAPVVSFGVFVLLSFTVA